MSLAEELRDDVMVLSASFSGRFDRLRSTRNQRRLLDDAAQRLRRGRRVSVSGGRASARKAKVRTDRAPGSGAVSAGLDRRVAEVAAMHAHEGAGPWDGGAVGCRLGGVRVEAAVARGTPRPPDRTRRRAARRERDRTRRRGTGGPAAFRAHLPAARVRHTPVRACDRDIVRVVAFGVATEWARGATAGRGCAVRRVRHAATGTGAAS